MLDRLTIERMAAKAGEGPILVALSGGGDSVALLYVLCAEFGAERLRACVVDHALRDGSAKDAARAAGFAETLGVAVSVTTLTWRDAANRAHEAAREARYAALCAVAREIGARVVATGHTRDDQAETVMLRASRGSGLRGLSGMRALGPMPIWPEGRGLWLARPLLGARREVLRDNLSARGAAWIDDPSNANEVYARVRVRGLLAGLAFDPMRLAAIAERLAPYVDANDAAARALIETAVTFDMEAINVGGAFWNGDAEVRRRALTVLVASAGAHQRGPSGEQIATLDAALQAPSFTSTTLGGALIRMVRGDVVLTRDRGALGGRADGTPGVAPLALEPGTERVWDNRVALTARDSGWSVVFENGAAVLARGVERAPLAHASPHWLVKDRVQHMLGCD